MTDRSRPETVSSAARVLKRPGSRAVIGFLAAGLVMPLSACGAPAARPAEPAPTTMTTTAAPTTTASAAPATTSGAPAPVRAPPAGVKLAGMDAPAAVALAPVARDGSLAVPDDVSKLGWWVGSSPMGADAGTTLIAGHVDSAEEGLGVFAQLRDLTEGDEVTVVDGLGTSYRFRVSGIQQVVKAELPAALFDTAGQRRLALVTCSGPFDSQVRSYRDNLIVWATPV